jgi:hypothetical protein
MRLKLSHKWLITILTGLLVITIGLLISVSYLFNNYWTGQPPTTRHSKKKEPRLAHEPISHWNFESTNSFYLNDVEGNKHLGNVKSKIHLQYPRKILNRFLNANSSLGMPEIVEGIKGNAIELNGNHWISGGNLSEYNTHTFTISTWVWRANDDDVVPTFMAKSSWPYDGWWLCALEGSIDMGIAWSESNTHIKSGYELPIKEWHHIAVTMNNETHEIQFFIDGLPFNDKHQNVPEWDINWNHDLFIGDYDGSGIWSWSGKIDETYYFDRILSHEEIYSIYKFEI